MESPGNSVMSLPSQVSRGGLMVITNYSLHTFRPVSMKISVHIQWRMQDLLKGGSVIIFAYAKIFRSHAHFQLNHAYFQTFLRETTYPTSQLISF